MEFPIYEIIQAIGKMFINPLFYWIILISYLISHKRVKEERWQFSKELFPIGSEYFKTIHISVIGSICISIILLLTNTVFVREIILFLSVIIFLLSFTAGFRFLSATYSLGFTFILFKILEAFNNRLFDNGQITNETFSTIALLVALFLFVEVAMYKQIKNETSFPGITKSKRGSWFGHFHLQKASFIPFLLFVPGELTISSITILPYITIGNESVSFVFIPFMTGFHHVIVGQLPETAAAMLRKNNFLLGMIVLIIALTSFYLPGLALIAIVISLLGKLFIEQQITKANREQGLYFLHMDEPLKILQIVPGSPAHRLGFRVGDTIKKVNDQPVHSITELNRLLVKTSSFPTFEIISANHEVKNIGNNKYKGDALSLGLIFPFIEENSID